MDKQLTALATTGTDFYTSETSAVRDSSGVSIVKTAIEEKQRPKKNVRFPIRYLIAILSFCGFTNVYGMRVNLSIAIVEMVMKRNYTNENGTVEVHQQFEWGSAQQGILLSSFFWGYIVTQLPGGLIASKFGGVKIFGLGILSTSILTLLTPVVTNYGGYNWLLVLRIIEGLGEGVTFPSQHAIWSKWAPKLERTKLVALSYSGSYAGTVIAMPVCGLLATHYGWECIFYVYGSLGALWTIFWYFLATESPIKHPLISVEEVEYISSTRDSEENNLNISSVPWKSIFKSAPVWAIIVAHYSENWGFYTLLTELPTYMKDILHFDLKKSGFLSGLPYLVLTLTMFLTGQLADFLRERKYLSTVAVRKLFNTLGYAFQTAFLLLTGFSQSSTLAVVYLVLAVGLGGFSTSSFSVNHLDVGPNYAGVLMGISNTVATVPGIITPTLTGLITTEHTASEWRVVFYISSAIYAFGALIFLTFASGEVQKWNEPGRWRAIHCQENVAIETGKNSEE